MGDSEVTLDRDICKAARCPVGHIQTTARTCSIVCNERVDHYEKGITVLHTTLAMSAGGLSHRVVILYCHAAVTC